jgi:hypothetical protein
MGQRGAARVDDHRNEDSLMAKKTAPTINRGVLSLDDIERAGIRYNALPEPPAPPPAAEEGSGLIRRLVGDTGVSLLKGAIAVPEAAIGLADLATGGRAGKLAEEAGFRAKDAKQILDEYYSPEQRAANAEVAKADGVVDTLGAAIANPSTIFHAVAESAPSLLGAGGVARGALALAPRLGGAVAAGIGEGVVSAGQTAEQVRQETDDGHLTGTQSLLAAGSGALTGLLGAAAGKVANRLGIGDVNQLVAGVRNAGPEVQKGVVRKLVEGFASEGLLQEFPQSAQEQIAQNVALGKQWDEGVANAATMGALAGGMMGAGAAPFGHGAQSPAEAGATVRAAKLPETGVLTKGLNAGIEAKALAVETEKQERDRLRDALTAASPAAPAAPDLSTAPGATPPLPEGSIAFEPIANIDTGDLALADAQETAQQNIARAAATQQPRALADAQDLVQRAAEQGREFAVVGHPAGGYMVMPRQWVTRALIEAAQPQERAPGAGALAAAERLRLEGEPDPQQLLGYDTAPTGRMLGGADGVVRPEVRADEINQQQDAAARPHTSAAPVAPPPLALEYDDAPTGRLIASEEGQVRPEIRAEQINREQEAREQRDREAARAELGLTPDVVRATMRAAMGNVTQDGDLLTAGGVPFRNRRAAAAAVARAGDGYRVVEVGPDSFVGRRQAEVGAEAPVSEETQTAAPAPREVPEMFATNGKPFKSKQIASIRARQNPGFAVVEVDGGWALRKPAADMAGEQLNKDWTAFSEETGSKKVPRAEMPQVKAEHRGALVNFLNARGVSHEQGEVPAHVLKPTQAEYSPAKVEQAKNFTGGDRSILASRDGHVLDGHHQWLAARDGGQNIKTIVFDAPIEQLLREVKEFPSAAASDGATPAAEGQGDLQLSRRDAPIDAKAGADAAGAVDEAVEDAPALKRAPTVAPGIAADDIRKALDPTIERWRSGPAGGVTVVQSFDDLPANIQTGLKALNAEGIVRALFMPRDQSVYLVADNLKSVVEAQFALFHEVYGHLGLRSMLSKGALEETLIRMQRSNPGLRREADQWFAQHGADEVASRVARGMKNGPATREVALLAVEEALADRAGKNVPISGLKFLLARIQKALRAIGFEHVADWMEARTDAEVLDLLRRARDSVHAELRPWEGAEGSPAMSTKDPDRPVLSRTPAEAIQHLTPQIVKDMLDGQRGFRSVHWWHKTVGTMYDLAEKNPSFRKVYDAAQAFLRDTSTFASDAADQAPRVLPQLNELKELGKALTLPEADRKAIAAPIFEGTLEWARDDAGKLIEATDVESAGVVFTDQELRDQFKLDDRQIELYREFRAAVDRSLDSTGAADVIRYLGDEATDGMRNLARSGEFKALKDVVLDHIDKKPPGKLQETMREEIAEKYDRLEKLKAAGYAPLSRFGQYAVHVQSGLNKTEFFGLYESSTDAARAARLLAKDFPNSSVQRSMMSQEKYKLLKGVSPETAMLFAKITGMDKNDALQDWIKNAAANRSAMKRMIKRKGTLGYSEDVTRVLSSFITSNARAASQGMHVGEMKVLTDAIHEGDVKDMASKLTEYVENPMEEAAALRGFMFVHFLGGSLASAAVNMTQPFMMTMPYLSQFAGIAGAAKVISKYTAAAAGGKVIDEDMRSALHIAEKEGIVSPQEVHQLQAMAMGRGSMFANAARFLGANDRVASAADTAGKRAMFIWGAPFALAEQFNRRLTFMAAYQVAKDKGMPDPFKFAAKAVVETQGVYNRANKPMWARGAIGATLFTFKQYSISYLEFMKRMWTAGEPGSQERADGRKAALFAMAVLIMAAGASGLPGADDLDDLVDTIGQRMGHDTNSKRWKQENLPAWLNYGFSALPGIPLDVAGRLGIGNLLPGTGLLRKDKSDKSGDVLEAFGPAGAVAKGVLDAADTKSIDPILPTAIKNLVKGVDTAVHGAYRDTKGRRVIDTTPVDAAVKAIGFQPANVAAASRAAGIQISRQALARNIEAEIASAWASARFENDLEAEREARQRLADWNETNPDTPIGITMGQIQKRVRQMRMTRQQRLGKSSTKELRAADARAG